MQIVNAAEKWQIWVDCENLQYGEIDFKFYTQLKAGVLFTQPWVFNLFIGLTLYFEINLQIILSKN